MCCVTPHVMPNCNVLCCAVLAVLQCNPTRARDNHGTPPKVERAVAVARAVAGVKKYCTGHSGTLGESRSIGERGGELRATSRSRNERKRVWLLRSAWAQPDILARLVRRDGTSGFVLGTSGRRDPPSMLPFSCPPPYHQRLDLHSNAQSCTKASPSTISP